VQPDLFVAPLDQVRTLDWRQVKDLLLVIEVLSPSSTRADRFTKRRLYEERRIPVYWVVDGDEGFVEVWTPEAEFPAVERDRLWYGHSGRRAAVHAGAGGAVSAGLMRSVALAQHSALSRVQAASPSSSPHGNMLRRSHTYCSNMA
jgi:hypothetical protein